MAPDSCNVKQKMLSTVDGRPRLGWYIAFVVTLNLFETTFHPLSHLIGG